MQGKVLNLVLVLWFATEGTALLGTSRPSPTLRHGECDAAFCALFPGTFHSKRSSTRKSLAAKLFPVDADRPRAYPIGIETEGQVRVEKGISHLKDAAFAFLMSRFPEAYPNEL